MFGFGCFLITITDSCAVPTRRLAIISNSPAPLYLSLHLRFGNPLSTGQKGCKGRREGRAAILRLLSRGRARPAAVAARGGRHPTTRARHRACSEAPPGGNSVRADGRAARPRGVTAAARCHSRPRPGRLRVPCHRGRGRAGRAERSAPHASVRFAGCECPKENLQSLASDF